MAAAYSVTTPDILQRILIYATIPALAACLLVCKNFYQVAGPILYRDVEIVDTKSTILEGAPQEPKTAGSSAAVQNLKVKLLAHVKTMTFILHRRHHCKDPFDEPPAVDMPDCDTIKVIFQARPRLNDEICFDCDEGDCGFRLGPAYNLLLKTRPKKLVWSNFRLFIRTWDLKSLEPILDHVEIFTLILHPRTIMEVHYWDTTRFLDRFDRKPIHLRIIICPWAPWVMEASGESVDIEQHDTADPPATEKRIAEFICRMNQQFPRHGQKTEIYLIEQWGPSTVCQQLPTKERAAELLQAWVTEYTGHPKYPKETRFYVPGRVVLKNRKDYLMEGVEDEIDSEELARWKRLQDIEDRMGVIQP